MVEAWEQLCSAWERIVLGVREQFPYAWEHFFKSVYVMYMVEAWEQLCSAWEQFP